LYRIGTVLNADVLFRGTRPLLGVHDQQVNKPHM